METLLDVIASRAEAREPVGVPAFWHLLAIARAAREVRAAQIAYFDTRERTDLIESKRLEKELDELLAHDFDGREA